MCQDSNERFNYRIKFIFNQKIYIKIMRCKIVIFQKFMWHNIMSSTKGKKSFGFTLQYKLSDVMTLEGLLGIFFFLDNTNELFRKKNI